MAQGPCPARGGWGRTAVAPVRSLGCGKNLARDTAEQHRAPGFQTPGVQCTMPGAMLIPQTSDGLPGRALKQAFRKPVLSPSQ